MEEKKLTDEEIIKTLEYCTNKVCGRTENCPLHSENDCIEIMSKNALDLIHRLQSERDKWFNHSVELQEKINTLLLDKNKQKAEIERLTEENRQLVKIGNGFALERNNLQDKVDELKAKQVVECHGMIEGCDMVKQAVKDTAEKFASLVEFHSVSTIDENGIEQFSISALGLKEILHEEFGIPYDEICKKFTGVKENGET